MSGDAVVDGPEDLLRANGDVEEPVANVEKRIDAVGKKKVAYVIRRRRRCVRNKGVCVSKERVDNLEAQLDQNIKDSEQYQSLKAQLSQSVKKSEQYYKLLQEKEKENGQLADKLVHVFQVIESKGNKVLVTDIEKIFPDDFAKARENSERDMRTITDAVAGNGNRFANGVKRKASGEESKVGFLSGGPDAKKMRRETVEGSYYNEEATDGVDDCEGGAESDEIAIIGESVRVVERAKEERSSPDVNVAGEKLLTEEEGLAESDLHSLVASYSDILKNGQVRCKECRQTIGFPSLMLRHVALHLQNSPYPCDICGKEMMTMSSLRLHRSRTCSGPVTCQACGKVCRSKGMLSSHKKMVHNGGRE